MLLKLPHVLPVHQDAALGHVVKAGDELAQGGLAAAGGTHHRHGLPGPHMQLHMLQHALPGALIAKRHVVHQNVALHTGQVPGVGGVLDIGLQTHQLHKAPKARHALHKLLYKGGELADGGDKGGHVQRKGGQIDKIHLPPHDEKAAEGNDQHGQDPHAEFHPRLIAGHGLVIPPLGPPELVVGGVELGALRVLVCEGLGRAHAGDGGFHLSVDARQLGLDLGGGVHHPLAGNGGKDHKNGDHRKHHQGQLPADGEHDAERAQNGHGGDEQVLRAMVGQLRDLKQVAGDPAHELAGAVLVVKGKGEILHMMEQVPPDIRLHAYAQQVPPVGDDEVKDALEHIGPRQQRHNHKKGGKELLGQKGLHRAAGHDGKRQVHHANAQGARHVQRKQLPVGFVIGDENTQISALFHLLGGQLHASSQKQIDDPAV